MLFPASSLASIINAILCINCSQRQRCRVQLILLHLPAPVFYLGLLCSTKKCNTGVQEPHSNELLVYFPVWLLRGRSCSLHGERAWTPGQSQGEPGKGNSRQERGDPAPLTYAQGFHPEISASQHPPSSCAGPQPTRLL